LDSLICFADCADCLKVASADKVSLDIDGPFAADLPLASDNLVLRAAGLFGSDQGARIALTKNLPVASGIGGGSADAAAALCALASLWGKDLPPVSAQARLGADVPVCVAGHATRARGIGDKLSPVPQMPVLIAVLVNPGRELPTATVFNATRNKENAGLPAFPSGSSPKEWIGYIARQRNDLTGAALSMIPEIGKIIGHLKASEGCHVARMSGSGATCFGLFESDAAAVSAALRIAEMHPNWWVQKTHLG